ncbi:hypothetical protein PtrSN002B_011679 [Pyrenophora tritici-repentis]|nr:hypothetical protein PtrSN002B_011679 [Pyrenophora tritici-repentis]
MPPKRKRSAVATAAAPVTDGPPLIDRTQMRKTEVPLPSNVSKPPRRQSSRAGKAEKTVPNLNPDILDSVTALRASPDGHEDAPLNSILKSPVSNGVAKDTSLISDETTEDKVLPSSAIGDWPKANGVASVATTAKNKRKKAGAQQVKVEEDDNAVGAAESAIAPAVSAGVPGDPDDADGLEAGEDEEQEVKEALSRPPPVNSEYLPLPWKGRLGYVCVLRVPVNLN